MHPSITSGISLLLVGLSVYARQQDSRLHANMMPQPNVPVVHFAPTAAPVISRNGTTLPPYSTLYYFDQLIDHNQPSIGTFRHRFWHTWEFYEPGGPIILMTPGETNAEPYSPYLTNRTINGLIAQQQNGSTIVLEHRFYGFSNPYPDLSVKSLRVHTIQQAIDDLEYFAKNVHLPMPNGDKVTPDRAPWILIGGSYSGALTSWTMVNKPGLFYAGYASSAVVQAITNFWRYFEPIRQNMPKNCSADVEAVIAHIDAVFIGNDTTAIQSIKDNFGFGNLSHFDDAAGALRNSLWDWQTLQVTSGAKTAFYKFCDALEVKDGEVAPLSGWGLDHALTAWGTYWRTFYLGELCGAQSVKDCLGTYDLTLDYWTNTTINNASRSWFWIVCNEVGYFQEGAPIDKPTLVSRLVEPAYDIRQCQQMFPAAFPEQVFPNTALTDWKYKGWNVKVDRLFFANGIRDPWREATLSADALGVGSTPSRPIGLSNGFHCSDMGVASAIDPTIAAVQNQALASMKTWLSTWKPQQRFSPITRPRSIPQSSTILAPPVKIKPVNACFRNFGHF